MGLVSQTNYTIKQTPQTGIPPTKKRRLNGHDEDNTIDLTDDLPILPLVLELPPKPKLFHGGDVSANEKGELSIRFFKSSKSRTNSNKRSGRVSSLVSKPSPGKGVGTVDINHPRKRTKKRKRSEERPLGHSQAHTLNRSDMPKGTQSTKSTRGHRKHGQGRDHWEAKAQTKSATSSTSNTPSQARKRGASTSSTSSTSYSKITANSNTAKHANHSTNSRSKASAGASEMEIIPKSGPPPGIFNPEHTQSTLVFPIIPSTYKHQHKPADPINYARRAREDPAAVFTPNELQSLSRRHGGNRAHAGELENMVQRKEYSKYPISYMARDATKQVTGNRASRAWTPGPTFQQGMH